jgi:hypothetical protein
LWGSLLLCVTGRSGGFSVVRGLSTKSPQLVHNWCTISTACPHDVDAVCAGSPTVSRVSQTPTYDQLRGERLNADLPAIEANSFTSETDPDPLAHSGKHRRDDGPSTALCDAFGAVVPSPVHGRAVRVSPRHADPLDTPITAPSPNLVVTISIDLFWLSVGFVTVVARVVSWWRRFTDTQRLPRSFATRGPTVSATCVVGPATPRHEALVDRRR